MVIATITSGLGNQLFQYALARQISINNKSSLYFDLRFYKSAYSKETSRSFKLDKFDITYLEINKPIDFLLKTIKLFPKNSFPPFFSTIKESYYHFDPEVLKVNDYLLNFKGYWHSQNYFQGVADKIKEELKFNNIPSLEFHSYKKEIENSENTVSIHIRRGDYVNHPEFSKTFGFIGLEYYQKAIELIKEKVFNCKFFIFTDDKDWVLNNFTQEENIVFVNNTGIDADLDDLHLMKLCNHNIIANSSFSWWGAWLNNNTNKIVIAPKKWFKDQPNWDTKDLLPPNWLKV